MVTKLSKPVSRRIGELVVTISADGVCVRRSGCRTASAIELDVLCERLAADAVGARCGAMQLPLPQGWCPQRGKHVLVSATASRATIGRVLSVRIDLVDPLIRLVVGRSGKELTVTLTNVRPVPIAVKSPERARPLLDLEDVMTTTRLVVSFWNARKKGNQW